ncbi:hypothetical protein QOT17_000689 [Balamuthia mandrillaris]
MKEIQPKSTRRRQIAVDDEWNACLMKQFEDILCKCPVQTVLLRKLGDGVPEPQLFMIPCSTVIRLSCTPSRRAPQRTRAPSNHKVSHERAKGGGGVAVCLEELSVEGSSLQPTPHSMPQLVESLLVPVGDVLMDKSVLLANQFDGRSNASTDTRTTRRRRAAPLDGSVSVAHSKQRVAAFLPRRSVLSKTSCPWRLLALFASRSTSPKGFDKSQRPSANASSGLFSNGRAPIVTPLLPFRHLVITFRVVPKPACNPHPAVHVLWPFCSGTPDLVDNLCSKCRTFVHRNVYNN